MNRIIIYCFLSMLLSSHAFSQRIITGNVSAGDGIGALPAATVMIKNSTRGVTTDFDGNYSINANTGDVLVFSFVGMINQEVTVGNQTEINVVMQEDLSELDEVIVIGYGTVSEEALTGSVAVLKGDKFSNANTTSLESTLQGNVAGLQMSSSDGQPGSNAEIRIRGIGSFSANSDPLYVIDGVPVQSGSESITGFSNDGKSTNVMSTINPNDIASVSVLKDASATSIYGSRGANGVILITTKSGSSGKMRINLSSQVGISSPAYKNLDKPINEKDYHTLFIEGYVNAGQTVEYAQREYDNYYPNPADTNWLEAIMRDGVTNQYNIDVSGGGERVTYFASVSYFDQKGVMIGSDFQRLSSRLNMSAKVTDRLTVTNNISIGGTKANGADDGTAFDNPMYGAYLVPAPIPIYNEEGQFYNGHVSFMMGGANPVGKMTEDERWLKQMRIIDNITASYKFTPNLTFKTAWSIDLIDVHAFEFDNGRYGDGRRVGGRAREGMVKNINWLGTQTLNYNKLFGDQHQLDVLLGYEAQKASRRSVEARGEGYPNPTLRTLASTANPTLATSSADAYSFLSMFSRVSYDFDKKYFATLSYRRDGSSRFGKENRWGNFWSVGASWILTEEDFMADVGWLNNLKVRASYGVTGNASIGNFDSLSLYGFGYDYAGIPGSAPSSVGNPILTWENQHSLDIGLTLGLFNNRVTSNLTYFKRMNKDLLLSRPLSTTSGFDSNLQNVGDMQNTGVEVDVNIGIVESDNFNWDFGGNVTFVKNKITKLEEPILDERFRKEEGRDFYEYYLTHWAGVDSQTGQGLWYTNGPGSSTTTDYNTTQRAYVGKSALPDFYGGVTTSLRYKNFELSGQFAFVWNKYLYNNPAFVLDGDGRYTPRSTSQRNFDNRWTTPGQDAKTPQFVWGNTTLSNSKSSTRVLYDATYVRLRDVTLSYNLPHSVTEKINVASVRVYVKGTNLLTWVRDKDLHLDPEAGADGVVDAFIPIAKTFTLGVNFGL